MKKLLVTIVTLAMLAAAHAQQITALTIANQSVTDPTAANRIFTGTSGDVACTNNPGTVTLIYNATVSRWILVNHN